jgi:hypothetical protein
MLVNQRILVVTLTSPLGKFYSRHPDLVNCCVISVSQMTTCSHVPFLVITIQSFPNTRVFTWIPTRVTLLVSHVEEKLLTIPEHQISPPVLSELRVARSLDFCVEFCASLFVLLLVIVLAVLRFTATAYPFYVLKLFLDPFKPTWLTINMNSQFDFLL